MCNRVFVSRSRVIFRLSECSSILARCAGQYVIRGSEYLSEDIHTMCNKTDVKAMTHSQNVRGLPRHRDDAQQIPQSTSLYAKCPRKSKTIVRCATKVPWAVNHSRRILRPPHTSHSPNDPEPADTQNNLFMLQRLRVCYYKYITSQHVSEKYARFLACLSSKF